MKQQSLKRPGNARILAGRLRKTEAPAAEARGAGSRLGFQTAAPSSQGAGGAPRPHAGAPGACAGLSRARAAGLHTGRAAPLSARSTWQRRGYACAEPQGPAASPRPTAGVPRSRYLEGLQSHKTRLAVLILDDEERAPIFIESEGPHRRHDAAARGSFPATGGHHSGTESAPSGRGRAPALAHAQSKPRETSFPPETNLAPDGTFWNPRPSETSIIRAAVGGKCEDTDGNFSTHKSRAGSMQSLLEVTPLRVSEE